MEMPEFTLEVIIESLAKIKVGEDTDQQIQDMIEKRLSNLDSDIVIKQRDRFAQLEEKVKIMLERKALNGGNNSQITPAQLQRIMQ